MFKKIKIKTWRQYENIDIDFHPRLTIITGANGAGKTTILGLLNRHFGWPSQLVGTPKKDKKTGGLKFFSDFWKDLFSSESPNNNNNNNQNVVGNISYENGMNTNIIVPTQVGSTYGIQFSSQQHIAGFHIPSHRPIYKYQNVPNISTQAISKQTAYHNYRSVKHQRYQGSSVKKSETYFIKETLISLATFGYGNQIVSRNNEADRIFEGFEDVLRNVLPPKLGFEKISIRIPEVILETKSGQLLMRYLLKLHP